jgi:hypothetical protein
VTWVTIVKRMRDPRPPRRQTRRFCLYETSPALSGPPEGPRSTRDTLQSERHLTWINTPHGLSGWRWWEVKLFWIEGTTRRFDGYNDFSEKPH